MGLFREIPPTAGFPLKASDFFRRTDGTLEQDFRRLTCAAGARVTYSGTAAAYFIFETLKTLSPKRTVVLPAFICPLVALAAQRAGLTIEVCDLADARLDLDYACLDRLCASNPDILCVVPAHLGGIPCDMAALERVTSRREVFVVEDCAQALGARIGNRSVGSFGDFAFFSMCRGKGLTIYEGGAAVARQPAHATRLAETIARLQGTRPVSEALKVLELFGYWLMYRPRLFWWVYGLPRSFWLWRGNPERAMIEEFDARFGTHAVGVLRQRVGHVQFSRLEGQTSLQRYRQRSFAARLRGVGGVRVLEELNGSFASYPYLTLLFDRAEDRQALERAASCRGKGVSRIYLHPLPAYGYLRGTLPQRDTPHAEDFCRRHVTVSTSEFVTERDIEEICRAIAR